MGWILLKYWIVGCIQWIVQVWNFCHMCPHHFDNPPNYTLYTVNLTFIPVQAKKIGFRKIVLFDTRTEIQ